MASELVRGARLSIDAAKLKREELQEAIDLMRDAGQETAQFQAQLMSLDADIRKWDTALAKRGG